MTINDVAEGFLKTEDSINENEQIVQRRLKLNALREQGISYLND